MSLFQSHLAQKISKQWDHFSGNYSSTSSTARGWKTAEAPRHWGLLYVFFSLEDKGVYSLQKNPIKDPVLELEHAQLDLMPP